MAASREIERRLGSIVIEDVLIKVNCLAIVIKLVHIRKEQHHNIHHSQLEENNHT